MGGRGWTERSEGNPGVSPLSADPNARWCGEGHPQGRPLPDLANPTASLIANRSRMRRCDGARQACSIYWQASLQVAGERQPAIWLGRDRDAPALARGGRLDRS